MPPIWRRLNGTNGSVDIPSIGAHLGEFASWTLTRRADEGPEASFYDLHAVLSFVNEALFNDPDPSYEKSVTVKLGRQGRPYRLEPRGEKSTVLLRGRSLIMERIELCQLDR